MATASVTYALSNGSSADAAEVNTNFNDLVSFLNGSVVHKDGSVSMTGALSLPASDPSDANHATRKQYVDRRAVRMASNAAPSVGATSTASTSGSATTLATVTITDPGYDIYVDGHASIAWYTTGQTSTWAVWALQIAVEGTVIDELHVPHSVAMQGSVGLSIGVPLRRTASATGDDTTVTMKVYRVSGDGTFNVGGGGATNNLQVYYTAQ
jgi:hypothetical protein